MKVAIFGGSGFIGYHFVRQALADPHLQCILFSSSAKSLVNVARHEVDLRLYTPSATAEHCAEPSVECIVNFSHPFGKRDGMDARQQIDAFVEYVRRQRALSPSLRLIHLSTMSVYEPFAEGKEFDEDCTIHPPHGDTYASDKAYVERRLRSLPEAETWQLHLRPTIVYGEFCRPWTDRILSAFSAGDVDFTDLGGRIQPIYGPDVARFVLSSVGNFQAGCVNLPGPQVMSWHEFLEFFGGIVGKGSLRHRPFVSLVEQTQSGAFSEFRRNLKGVVQAALRDPHFEPLALPITQWLPKGFVNWVRRLLLSDQAKSLTSVTSMRSQPSPFTGEFFASDRLVSSSRLRAQHPDLMLTPLANTESTLRRYYAFRYTDAWPQW